MKDLQSEKIVKNFIEKNKKIKTKKSNYIWIMEITTLAFVISFFFSFISETTLPNVNIIIGLIIVLVFIMVGVLFDMIGIAVTSADDKPFHAMSSKKIRGAALASKILKNSAKVSSFCNDVVGDICGIISGSAGIIIAIKISALLNTELFITTLIVTSVIAALTIGGKALGKALAVNKSNIIVYEFAKVISYVYNK